MRWSKSRPAGSLLVRYLPVTALAVLGLISAFLVHAAPEEKKIAIYSSAANYSLSVSERNGQDYVGLLEILEPLGTVSSRAEGSHWKLRYNDVDAVFVAGKKKARVRGQDVDLGSAFLIEGGRGLVPVASLVALMPRILGGPVSYHDNSRRLFIGNVAVHFTAQVRKGNPPALVMDFTSPVNPSIATEPGKLRMTFRREPLVPPGSQTLTFDDKTIPSATYQESNGAAEVTVSGTAPLFASFSNDGRTITIAPAPQANTTVAPPPAPAVNAAPAAASTTLPAPAPPRQYFAVIDASHGGAERGAALSDQLAEKDVTLAFARRLRQELNSRGITALVLRDGDATLSLDQRADLANSVHPAIYLCVHAASMGSGVRVYTALLPAGGENRGLFLDFDTAQASSRATSQEIAVSISSEMQKKQIAVRVLSAGLRPLNNLIAPAIALEIAPPSGSVADLMSAAYQESVSVAVANAVLAERQKLEAQR